MIAIMFDLCFVQIAQEEYLATTSSADARINGNSIGILNK